MAIIEQNPTNFQTNVIRNPFIWVRFSEDLDRTTISDYTVIVTETDNPDNIIPGRVDYIVGTKKVTFQLFDFLKKNTSYTVILVGGTNGIYKLSPYEPFSGNNYTFSFTTGESIDWNLPLATSAKYEDGPYFQGEDGIYKEVFGRTGEPVSHIVTTAAEVSPSGVIVPAPFGPERYLPPSGEYEETAFELVSTDPEDNEVGVTDSDIDFLFNSTIKSVESVTIKVSDILEYELTDENNLDNYNFAIDNKTYIITPTGSLDGLRKASDYEITLSNVVDIIDRSISSVKIDFQTKISPFYTTVKVIRINLGSLITQIEDSEIRLLIYENSLWAYENVSDDQAFLIDEPILAATNYVICKTKLDLLERHYIKSGAVESKQLADLRIMYGPALESIIQGKIEKLEKCVKKNELLLTTGSSFIKPVSAVKSYWDPRKPKWKRLGDPVDFNWTEIDERKS